MKSPQRWGGVKEEAKRARRSLSASPRKAARGNTSHRKTEGPEPQEGAQPAKPSQVNTKELSPTEGTVSPNPTPAAGLHQHSTSELERVQALLHAVDSRLEQENEDELEAALRAAVSDLV